MNDLSNEQKKKINEIENKINNNDKDNKKKINDLDKKINENEKNTNNKILELEKSIENLKEKDINDLSIPEKKEEEPLLLKSYKKNLKNIISNMPKNKTITGYENEEKEDLSYRKPLSHRAILYNGEVDTENYNIKLDDLKTNDDTNVTSFKNSNNSLNNNMPFKKSEINDKKNVENENLKNVKENKSLENEEEEYEEYDGEGEEYEEGEDIILTKKITTTTITKRKKGKKKFPKGESKTTYTIEEHQIDNPENINLQKFKSKGKNIHQENLSERSKDSKVYNEFLGKVIGDLKKENKKIEQQNIEKEKHEKKYKEFLGKTVADLKKETKRIEGDNSENKSNKK